MTPQQINAMPAGLELDRLVAERVMGLHVDEHGRVERDERLLLPLPYSTDIAAAWKVLEAVMTKRAFTVSIQQGWCVMYGGDPTISWAVTLFSRRAPIETTAETIPLAICRAALKAILPPPTTATPAPATPSR